MTVTVCLIASYQSSLDPAQMSAPNTNDARTAQPRWGDLAVGPFIRLEVDVVALTGTLFTDQSRRDRGKHKNHWTIVVPRYAFPVGQPELFKISVDLNLQDLPESDETQYVPSDADDEGITVAGILTVKRIAYTTKLYSSLIEFRFATRDDHLTRRDLIQVALDNKMDLFHFVVYHSTHMRCRH